MLIFLFRYLRITLHQDLSPSTWLTFGEWQLLCVRGSRRHTRMLGHLPDFCPLDSSSILGSDNQKKHLQTFSMSQGVRSPLVESHCFLFRVILYLGTCGICILFLWNWILRKQFCNLLFQLTHYLFLISQYYKWCLSDFVPRFL